MHKFIDSGDDTLAVKLSHTITGDDLDAIMDRFDEILSRHDKMRFFVETQDIDGLQLSSIPHHLSHSIPMLGQLRRFGRVAVVADQAWMRFATRLESAVLPYVSYRVYEPKDRHEALEWLDGKVPA